jgi:hypothetical protein
MDEKIRYIGEDVVGVNISGTQSVRKPEEWLEEFKKQFGTDQYGGKFAWRQDLVVPFIRQLLNVQKEELDEKWYRRIGKELDGQRKEFAEALKFAVKEEREKIIELIQDKLRNAQLGTQMASGGFVLEILKDIQTLK